MDIDWGSVNDSLDDLVIVAGVIWLVARQFIWRSTDVHRMLRLPVLITLVGVVLALTELRGDIRWAPADWILVGELVLVGVTGTTMGYVTRFRLADRSLQYKSSRAGVLLWLLFVVIRLSAFALASALGANLTDAAGVVLVSFGVNRLAAIAVVRRRAQAILSTPIDAEIAR